MNAQLEHKMIKEGRPQLQQIRNKTSKLNGLLWAALLTDDDGTAQHDLQCATTLALEVARELLEFTGGSDHALASFVAAPKSSSDQG